MGAMKNLVNDDNYQIEIADEQLLATFWGPDNECSVASFQKRRTRWELMSAEGNGEDSAIFFSREGETFSEEEIREELAKTTRMLF